MTGAPDPDARPHRRRHSNAWKNTPAGVRIAVAVCLVTLVVVLYVLQRSGVKAPPPPPSMSKTFDTLAPKLPKMDLVLSKSSLNLRTRRIEGVVTNTSARVYTNIEISFFTINPGQTASEIRVATVDRVAPHESAPFTTAPVAKNMDEWSMKEIKATPADDPPSR